MFTDPLAGVMDVFSVTSITVAVVGGAVAGIAMATIHPFPTVAPHRRVMHHFAFIL